MYSGLYFGLSIGGRAAPAPLSQVPFRSGSPSTPRGVAGAATVVAAVCI